MNVQIRIVITVPPEDESRYTIAAENIVKVLSDAIFKEFPHMRDDEKNSLITIVMSKMSEEKEFK